MDKMLNDLLLFFRTCLLSCCILSVSKLKAKGKRNLIIWAKCQIMFKWSRQMDKMQNDNKKVRTKCQHIV